MRVLKVGERGSAAAAGAIMGGAVGVMLGSALARPAPPPVVYAPPAEVVEEVEPADEVIVRKRPARRVVEIEEDEDVGPRVVQEEECVTRRAKVYPLALAKRSSDANVIAAEGPQHVEALHHWRGTQRHELG
jgi:hypothetical protein